MQVLRHRALAGGGAHDREEDPGPARRGRGRRQDARRRDRRDAHHRQLARRRSWGTVCCPLRSGGQTRRGPACRGAVRAAGGPRRAGRSRGHGHRLGGHPHRDIRSESAGARCTGQGADRDRAVLRGLGARCRGLRRGTGLDIRDPRDGRRPRAHGGGLPPRDRHRRVPVRRPPPPGGRQPHARRAAAAGCVHRPHLSPGVRIYERARPARQPAGCARCQACSAVRSIEPLLQIGTRPS